MGKDSRKPFVQSDDLVWLVAAMEKMQGTGVFSGFVQIKLIVDANVVISAVLWQVRKAQTPDARPALLELLQSEAIECYAPSFLRAEVEEKLRVRSNRYGYDQHQAYRIWNAYAGHMLFVDVGGPTESDEPGWDPKDAPYLKLQQQLDVPVVTEDRDIEQMGGASVPSRLLVSIRSYARESATVIAIQWGGTVIATVPLILLRKMCAASKMWLAKPVQRVPARVWSVAAAVAVSLLASRRGRAWTSAKIASALEFIRSTGARVWLDSLEPLLNEYQRAQQLANAERNALSAVNLCTAAPKVTAANANGTCVGKPVVGVV